MSHKVTPPPFHPNTKPPYKRHIRNFLINPKYQLKYVFFLSVSGLVLTAAYASITYYYIHENYALLIELLPMTDETKTQLYTELHQLILGLVGFSVVFLAIVSLIGIVISHRTAGALFHFKKIFNEIKNGNAAARLHPRPKDDFQDVAQVFNEMMDSVQKPKQN